MIRIISLTDAGERLGKRLANEIEGSELWHKPKPFSEKVQSAFTQGDRLILICATGIAVRTLAPVLKDKYTDPAVLVLDEQGRFVIPLISGHEGGANDWGEDIANLLSGQLVSTTAKAYLKPVYTVGMGCERGCPVDHLAGLLDDCLSKAGLSLDDIHSINSIDIKADEVGLIGLAKQIGKPFQTFDVPQLETVEQQLSMRSEYVFGIVGVYGVAESAALFAAENVTGEKAELVLVKQKTKKATCSIARSYKA
jgi:cobalt-precorrin 5A hydrolase